MHKYIHEYTNAYLNSCDDLEITHLSYQVCVRRVCPCKKIITQLHTFPVHSDHVNYPSPQSLIFFSFLFLADSPSPHFTSTQHHQTHTSHFNTCRMNVTPNFEHVEDNLILLLFQSVQVALELTKRSSTWKMKLLSCSVPPKLQ